MLPYDYLVVATGLQDDALHALKIQSMGVACRSHAKPLRRGGARHGWISKGQRCHECSRSIYQRFAAEPYKKVSFRIFLILFDPFVPVCLFYLGLSSFILFNFRCLPRLVEGGTLVKSLIWNPLSYAVVGWPGHRPERRMSSFAMDS